MSSTDFNPVLGVSSIDSVVSLNTSFLTRHGVIAGSTGTGKSRAMQVIAEQLTDNGLDVFVSDVKGDASGFCIIGKPSKRNTRAPFKPHAINANYWSISSALTPLRFSLNEIGAVLFSRLLELNSTQESHLVLAFSYAKRNGFQLHTTDDLLSLLAAISDTNQRGISKSSLSVIERKIRSLQESGLDNMFGEPSLELDDLKGLNVLNLSDSRRNIMTSLAPAFLLQKLFNELLEVGDVQTPKYVIFFDEAHYLFKDANKSLRNLIVTILKQIRSKGVAVFFITQDVTDLPEDVLSQLSTKIIFAQRIATAKGENALKALSRSFLRTREFDIVETLKSLAPGVALVTTLDEKGKQTKPVKVDVFAPATTMNVISYKKLREETDQELLEKYSTTEREHLHHQKAKHANFKSKTGPSFLDGFMNTILRFTDFFLKIGGKITKALVIKPLQGFFKWMFKKPIRIGYFLLFLLILYILIVNWSIVSSFFNALKFS